MKDEVNDVVLVRLESPNPSSSSAHAFGQPLCVVLLPIAGCPPTASSSTMMHRVMREEVSGRSPKHSKDPACGLLLAMRLF